jgi:hypothetical protein
MIRVSELTDKYNGMTRAHDKGATDGGSNLPESGATAPTETELNIIAIAQEDLDKICIEQKEKNDGIIAKIRTLQRSLPETLRFTAEEFLTKAESKIFEVDRELVRLYRIILARQLEYRFFKSFHHLQREAAPAPSLYVAFSWLALALVGDGGLNAYFFKDVGPLGLVGGFLIAFVISLCNIALGFMIGWGPLRYFGHRFTLHLLWACPLFIFLLFSVGAFDLGVAHYRDLVVKQPDIEVTGVVDDLKRNALIIPSFQSCLMALVGIGVAVFSAVKGYTVFDRYPWYGWHYRRKEQAETDLEAEVQTIQEGIDALGEEYLAEAKRRYDASNESVQEALALFDGLDQANQEFQLTAKGINDSCNAVLRRYRDANIQVRDVDRYPAPRYFVREWTLSKRADVYDETQIEADRAAIEVQDRGLRSIYETLEKTIPEAARTLLSEEQLKKRLEDVMVNARRIHEAEVAGVDATRTE